MGHYAESALKEELTFTNTIENNVNILVKSSDMFLHLNLLLVG